MDQVKIGRFIAQCRKKQGLTQMQLAEQLSITDRAVSKWETGKSLPDSALMLDLCGILHITVNDLLCGEVVTMEHYNENAEKTLLEMVRQKEAADKHLLVLEIIIGALALIILFTFIFATFLIPMPLWLQVLLMALGFGIFLIAMCFGLRIEQVAGYYLCRKCGHRYVPTYGSVFLAMHIQRTRYMRCPHCHKFSWQRKVLRKQ